MLASFQLWSLGAEAEELFKPTLLESGESKFVLFSACHSSRTCSLLGVCLCKEVRMDPLSGLRSPGLGWQDVEYVYFLFILEVYFPANTCVTAMPLLQGSQCRHTIAYKQSCKNKSISSTQPYVPAGQACTGRADQSLGTIWSSGREGRKTISNSRH